MVRLLPFMGWAFMLDRVQASHDRWMQTQGDAELFFWNRIRSFYTLARRIKNPHDIRHSVAEIRTTESNGNEATPTSRKKAKDSSPISSGRKT
jgi:hypothetical protein